MPRRRSIFGFAAAAAVFVLGLPVGALRAAAVPDAGQEVQDRARDKAHSAVAARGYAFIGDLVESDDGLWRGEASKDGRRWQVEVDANGNFTRAPEDESQARERPERRRKIQLFLILR
ncbi:MAG: hypothetical protein AB7E79_16530 [Rhodospirillaceae bacterium]